jgi:hypothetical protein
MTSRQQLAQRRALVVVEPDSVADVHLGRLHGVRVGSAANSLPMTAAPPFTERQGQYLAFIHAYSRVCGRPPAERDLERYFHVSAPTVHQTLLTLERLGLIARTARAARSVRVLLPPEQLPVLR